MYKDDIEYYLQELRSSKEMPYTMANEELADELFPHVKAIYPCATMVKIGTGQYIVVTGHARNILLKKLAASRVGHENCIAKIEKAVNELKDYRAFSQQCRY